MKKSLILFMFIFLPLFANAETACKDFSGFWYNKESNSVRIIIQDGCKAIEHGTFNRDGTIFNFSGKLLFGVEKYFSTSEDGIKVNAVWNVSEQTIWVEYLGPNRTLISTSNFALSSDRNTLTNTSMSFDGKLTKTEIFKRSPEGLSW